MYGGRQQQQVVLEEPTFPNMSIVEICECLVALNIPIQQEEIAKPSAATAQHIYTCLVQELMGAPVDAMDAPKQSVMGMMEYRELFCDALGFTMFFHHARTLVETCGVRGFAMSDLTRPDGGRLRHQLSGIMNFAKYRDEKAAYQQSLQEGVRRSAERATKLGSQLQRIEQSINEISAKTAADLPKTEQAKERNDKLRGELLDLRNAQIHLSHEVEELKQNRLKANESATGKVNELAQIQAQISSARSRLVQSPDRIKKHISEMSHTVTADKATLTGFQRKGVELGKRLEVIAALENDVRGLIDLEKGIEAQQAKVDEARRGMMALKARLGKGGIASQELVTRTGQLQLQLEHATQRHQRSEEMTLEMRQKAESKIERLKAEYFAVSKERNVVAKQRERIEAEQKELEGEMRQFVEKHEEELSALMDEYWQTRRQAETYMNTIENMLGLREVGSTS